MGKRGYRAMTRAAIASLDVHRVARPPPADLTSGHFPPPPSALPPLPLVPPSLNSPPPPDLRTGGRAPWR
eukprot:102508-Hanusia_phi.AAC.1